MRIAYFDCFSGISGDMTLGAFLDAGLSIDTLSKELAKLKLKGYEIKANKVRRGGFVGTKFDCVVENSAGRHSRSLKEIIALIEKSSLAERVKTTAKDIFNRIASVEASLHGIKVKGEIRLHELGDIDSIVDIVGAAIAIEKLGIEEVYSSTMNFGRTFVNAKHGRLPVPAPASLELLKDVPVKISDIEAELVTPTGAGILKSLSKDFGQMPQMKISRIGYGAGARDLTKTPNMLRIIIGEKEPSFKEDNVYVVETNIDDMNPQNFEYVIEKLFREGALDVYTTSVQMKKSRPAFKLTVLTEPHNLTHISSVIFSETTTIGIRFYEASRFKLERKTVKVRTRFGEVKVKLSSGPAGLYTASPEYEECVKLARQKNVPLKTIYDEAKRAVKV